MKKVFLLLLLLYGNLVLAKTLPDNYITLGILQSFWRNQPVIGRWLSKGQGLIKVPSYMFHTSFPYKKKNYSKEVPFADSLNIVRLLGGWNYLHSKGELNGAKEADLIYKKNSQFGYRFDLLKKRLDPYINVGYQDLTLVLDNIPWALAKKPKLGFYGQINPPGKIEVWKIFIDKIIKKLQEYYPNTVKNFRYRIGTEYQNKNRFNGNLQEYLKLYTSSVQAIRKHLPSAKIGPFNFAGSKRNMVKANINMYLFIKSLKQYEKQDNISYLPDFLPVSTYYIVKKKHKKNIKKLLDIRSIANRTYFQNIESIMNKKVSREIHEFGIINRTLSGIKSNEPGARGAAWRLYMIFNMMENKISRLYHWRTFDKVERKKYLLKGNGWLYTVLDYLKGGKSYLLPTSQQEDIIQRTLIVKKAGKTYLLTTLFSDKRDRVGKVNVNIKIPKNLLYKKDSLNLKWTYLSKNTSVLDILRKDLEQIGGLRSIFYKDDQIIGRVKDMANQQGKKYIKKHWEKYTNTIKNSLLLKDFKSIVKENSKYLTIKYPMDFPSVSVIEIR